MRGGMELCVLMCSAVCLSMLLEGLYESVNFVLKCICWVGGKKFVCVLVV